MSFPIGIDLGTTNSVAAVYRRGVVETLRIDGRMLLPSVVSFQPDGNILVGQAARSRLLVEPDSSISSAKRFMGDPGKSYKIGRQQLTPTNVATLVLKRLADGAGAALEDKVRDVVITVPAYFTEAEKENTRRAGEEAGLNVLRIIPEPTAAAIAYGLDKGKNQTIMVYDLGGGTFDVSILQVKGNQFIVKAVGGDNRLGGDDFDAAIVDWVCAQLPGNTILHTSDNLVARHALQRLREAAEIAKKELAEADQTVISLPDFMGQPLEIELSLAQYNTLIAPLLDRTIQCMRSVLKDASLHPDEIDRVLLVGGSTKNRAVRAIVAQEIKEPFISDHVDEVVAHGAAIVAADLFAPEESNLPIEVCDVTAHSYGTDVLDQNNELFVMQVIPRQSPIPCRTGLLCWTNHPMQKRVISKVYRGEHWEPEKNTELGELVQTIQSPSPDLVALGVVFELDADGIIHFTEIELSDYRLTAPIIEAARQNRGLLDLAAIDQLIETGSVPNKTIKVHS